MEFDDEMMEKIAKYAPAVLSALKYGPAEKQALTDAVVGFLERGNRALRLIEETHRSAHRSEGMLRRLCEKHEVVIDVTPATTKGA